MTTQKQKTKKPVKKLAKPAKKAVRDIKVGQVWQNEDDRRIHRYIKVLKRDNDHAICFNGGKVTRIRLDRFKTQSNGYSYVKHENITNAEKEKMQNYLS